MKQENIIIIVERTVMKLRHMKVTHFKHVYPYCGYQTLREAVFLFKCIFISFLIL